MFAALVIALVAIGLAIGSWFRPLPDNKPTPASSKPAFTDQQVADAKANVCAAFAKVDHALDIAGARSGGSDQTAILAVATGTRQVLDAGSRYLLTKLAEEPSTPPHLADQTRKLANTWQELAVDYLAELSDSELNPSLRASDEATSTIRGLCK